MVRKMESNEEILRRLIVENPSRKLLIFASEDANIGDFGYEEAEISSVGLSSLCLYNNEYVDKDCLKEKIADDNGDNYPELSDEEYDKWVNEEVSRHRFIDYIVVYVG